MVGMEEWENIHCTLECASSRASVGMFVYKIAGSLPLKIADLTSKYLQHPRPSAAVGPVLLLKVKSS